MEGKYKVIREEDGKMISGNTIFWIEWNEDGSFKSLENKIEIGRSLIINPGGSNSWLTTPVIEVQALAGEYLRFQTKTSLYELYYNPEIDLIEENNTIEDIRRTI